MNYIWKSWSGARRKIEDVGSVEFKPFHVVFLDYNGWPKLAVDNQNVHDLHPDTDPDPKWWDS